jgi:hypothetical protein
VGVRLSRRQWSAALTLGIVALALCLPSDAGAASSYTATADARLIAVDLTTSPPILFDPLFDGGVSVAQAQIDSLGGTAAFASDPYPGGTVIGLPSLLGTATGGAIPSLPAYPLLVTSDQGTPSGHIDAGTVVLDAQSRPGSSTGRTTDGVASAQATTTADADGGRVHAHAETAIPSVQLSPLLSLNGLRSAADATRSPSGSLARSSSFEVAALTILGQRVALTPTGLSLLGTDIPLGLDPNAVLSTLLSSLAAQGTTVEFLPPTNVPDGVTSAGLRITTVQHPPAEIASGLDSVRVQVTLGRASAFVTNSAFGASDGVEPAVPESSVDGVSPTIGGAPGLSIAPVPSLDSPRSQSPAGTGRPQAGVAYVVAELPLGRFYPALVLAACLGLVIVNVIRHWGVRRP